MKNIGIALLVFIAIAVASQLVQLALTPERSTNESARPQLTKESYLEMIREQGGDEYATADEYECVYSKMIDDMGVDAVWRLDKQAQFGTSEEQDAAGEKTHPYLSECLNY